MKTTLALVSLLTLSTAACLEEDDMAIEDEAALGETESAVSWTGLSGFYQTQTTGNVLCTFRDCEKDLGPANDRTCFLAGLRGDLADGTSFYPQGALVQIVGTRWKLQMLNPYGSGIGARTICIPNRNNRIVAQSWRSTTPVATIPASVGSKRRCFLAGVKTYTQNSFKNWDTDVKIRFNSNNTHTVMGSFPANSNVHVYTTCVDLSEDLGYGYWGNGTGSTVSSVMATNDGGVACGLTGIGGRVETMSQGVDMDYLSPNWVWWISPYSAGHEHCFK